MTVQCSCNTPGCGNRVSVTESNGGLLLDTIGGDSRHGSFQAMTLWLDQGATKQLIVELQEALKKLEEKE